MKKTDAQLREYVDNLVRAKLGDRTWAELWAEWSARVRASPIRFRRVKALRGKTFADLIHEGRHEPGTPS